MEEKRGEEKRGVQKYQPRKVYNHKSEELQNFKGTLHPKIELYQEIVLKNKAVADEIQVELNEYREEIAEKLLAHSNVYNASTRSTVASIVEKEKEAKKNYYEARMEAKEYLRIWRLAMVKKIADDAFRKAVLSSDTFTKFMELDSSVTLSETSNTTIWNYLIKKEDIYKPPNVAKLGKGAFGKVYRGIVYGSVVAIKELRVKRDLKGQPLSSAIERFKGEISLLSRIKHNRILRFMGACIEIGDPGYYALLTEVAENGSLVDILYNVKQNSVPVKLSFYRKMMIIGEIVEGMQHLHDRDPPIVHLDLKASNILLDENYHVKIADFGLSRVNNTGAVTHLLEDFKVGTPYYMAPEIISFEFGKQISTDQAPKADVYSFGILVNEIVSEQKPYKDVSDTHTLERLKKTVTSGCEQGVHRPYLWHGECPSINDLIQECWSSDPSDRPSFEDLNAKKLWVKAAEILPMQNNDFSKKIVKLFSEEVTSIAYDIFWKAVRDHFELENEVSFGQKGSLALLAIMEVGNAKLESVNKEQVDRFANWFQDVPQEEFVAFMYQLCTSPWYFGFLDEPGATRILSLPMNNQTGKFLVRWDKQRNSWYISFLERESKKVKKVVHEDLTPRPIAKSIKNLINNLNYFVEQKKFKIKKPATGRPNELVAVTMRDKFACYILGDKDGKYTTAQNRDTGVVDLNNSIRTHINFVL